MNETDIRRQFYIKIIARAIQELIIFTNVVDTHDDFDEVKILTFLKISETKKTHFLSYRVIIVSFLSLGGIIKKITNDHPIIFFGISYSLHRIRMLKRFELYLQR